MVQPVTRCRPISADADSGMQLPMPDWVNFMQVCPCDCRHTLAIISNHAGRSRADSLNAQHSPQQLELYVYETEVEGLARHMLLLMLLFDGSFTAQGRAEMFLELHGNALLRQQTADWVCKSPA